MNFVTEAGEQRVYESGDDDTYSINRNGFIWNEGDFIGRLVIRDEPETPTVERRVDSDGYNLVISDRDDEAAIMDGLKQIHSKDL